MKQSEQAFQQAAANQTQPGNTIGIDLGDGWSRHCVVDASGAIVEQDRIRTTMDAMREMFRKLASMRMVIEAGTHSPWVSRLLEECGHQVVVADPRKVRLIYESDRKNDRLDARMLARLGRVDVSLLSPVWHRSAEAQVDLAVVRSRNALVAARTQLINAVRGMVKSTGGRLPKSTTAAFAAKIAGLVPLELKLAVAPLLKSIRALSDQIRNYDAQSERLVDKKYPETKLLRQVKGVGPLIALTYVLTVEDPSRSAEADSWVASWGCGQSSVSRARVRRSWESQNAATITCAGFWSRRPTTA